MTRSKHSTSQKSAKAAKVAKPTKPTEVECKGADINSPELCAHIDAIRELKKQTIANMISIGEHLTKCKGIVGHGGWTAWLKREFNWSQDTASRFMRLSDPAFRKLRSLKLPVSSLYALTAPGTPEAVRNEIVAAVEDGKKPTVAEVAAAVTAAKPPRKPKGKGTAPQTTPLTWSDKGEGLRRFVSAEIDADRGYRIVPVGNGTFNVVEYGGTEPGILKTVKTLERAKAVAQARERERQVQQQQETTSPAAVTDVITGSSEQPYDFEKLLALHERDPAAAISEVADRLTKMPDDERKRLRVCCGFFVKINNLLFSLRDERQAQQMPDDSGSKLRELERLLGAAKSEIGDLEIALRTARGDPADTKLIVITAKMTNEHIADRLMKVLSSWDDCNDVSDKLSISEAEFDTAKSS